MMSLRRVSTLVLGLALLAVSGITVGCGSPAVQDTETVVIAGSTSVQPLSELLAEEFMKERPGVQVTVQGGGSTAGVRAVTDRVADIGAVSRPLREGEEGLKQFVIALDAIAIVVHPDNPVEELTFEQVREIYAGQITNWSALGGPDRAISLVTREEGSGTRTAFEELVMGGTPIAEGAVVQNSNGAVRATVAQDPSMIGYLSLAYVTPEVKVLRLDGVEPTVDNVKEGRYPLARPFIYVTREAPQGLVKEYLDFVLSEAGQAIVEEAGVVPAR